MHVIPAIDIYDGKVVRLKKGNFGHVSFYPFTPLEQAIIFKDHGFNHIHIVDLAGSGKGRISVLEIIEEIKAKTGLTIQFGGGIRSLSAVHRLLNAGIDNVIIGSLSITSRQIFEEITEAFSPSALIVAVDSENERIKISGWTEDSGVSLFDHIDYCLGLGVKRFLCTDISRDGMLEGANIKLYSKIISGRKDIELIASGGIKDIPEIISLKELGLYAAVVGKSIYEGVIDLRELAKYAV